MLKTKATEETPAFWLAVQVCSQTSCTKSVRDSVSLPGYFFFPFSDRAPHVSNCPEQQC